MEDHPTRLKRLRMRSWHRGIKEMDLILGGFADNEMSKLSIEELN
ncbi:succinate dehydrogenase assembly factor 2, partial [Amylibacter sp.]|nr:succinate dehydrogenase assembly factor 2 [Amylibacter sp.]